MFDRPILTAAATADAPSLLDLADGAPATILAVRELDGGDAIAVRLRDLGFVPGEPVHVVAHAPFGRDPIAVQVGYTRFALRRAEAARVLVASATEPAS